MTESGLGLGWNWGTHQGQLTSQHARLIPPRYNWNPGWGNLKDNKREYHKHLSHYLFSWLPLTSSLPIILLHWPNLRKTFTHNNTAPLSPCFSHPSPIPIFLDSNQKPMKSPLGEKWSHRCWRKLCPHRRIKALIMKSCPLQLWLYQVRYSLIGELPNSISTEKSTSSQRSVRREGGAREGLV